MRFKLWAFVSSERFHEGRPVSYWLSAVKGGADAVRVHAAHVLGEIGPESPEVVPTLIEALKDKDAIVCKEAAVSLGKIGPQAKSAAPELVRLLEGGNPIVRRAAAASLGMIEPDAQVAVPALLKALKDADGPTRIQAIMSLGQVGEPEQVIPLLIPILRERGGAGGSPSSAAQAALQAIGPKTVPALIEALSDQQAETRLASLRILGRFGNQARAAVSRITALLQDPDELVCVNAAEALWKVDRRAQAAIPVLIQGLKNQQSWPIRSDASYILGQIGPEAKAAVPALIELLRDQYDDIRRNAIEALGRIGPEAKTAVPALRAALQDEEASVRQKAAQALKLITGES
jgi:HEAT repeat protein